MPGLSEKRGAMEWRVEGEARDARRSKRRIFTIGNKGQRRGQWKKRRENKREGKLRTRRESWVNKGYERFNWGRGETRNRGIKKEEDRGMIKIKELRNKRRMERNGGGEKNHKWRKIHEDEDSTKDVKWKAKERKIAKIGTRSDKI